MGSARISQNKRIWEKTKMVSQLVHLCWSLADACCDNALELACFVVWHAVPWNKIWHPLPGMLDHKQKQLFTRVGWTFGPPVSRPHVRSRHPSGRYPPGMFLHWLSKLCWCFLCFFRIGPLPRNTLVEAFGTQSSGPVSSQANPQVLQKEVFFVIVGLRGQHVL